MAKGFKLKELLAHEKGKVNEKKTTQASQKRIEGKQPELKPESESESESDEEKNDNEEYVSQTLSKKEKRKLKKALKKSGDNESLITDDANADQQDVSKSRIDLDRLENSDSEEEDFAISKPDDASMDSENDEDKEDEEEEEEEDVPLSDVEFDSDADVVPHHKLTINNTKALKHSLERIQLPWAKHSFEEHQSVTSETNTDEGMKDIYDDTERELAFYKQSLDAVNIAKEKLKKLKVPFKRPLDYFAEMVKNDEHMDKIKHKLVQEASEKKAREDARKQRQLKKFGKQVQVATLQKRQLEKRETLDRIKNLKKKRKHNEIGDMDFNVGIEEATESEDTKRRKPNSKRQAKNSKYGQGGMKRFKRKNDAQSSADITGFSNRKKSRPGKSRRK
ncbi:rRNA-processing protein EBP2 [Nakaseomyces glabratus]|uniref:rRNA-processing protein EBP2 n=1 Tax=Candida glabrata TaxID=5478 RepID=A0A0W0CWF9_CANGB|nr:rRNA-processing protein EBP2 [Nakaseomyces glabratus]KTB03929.1 rRNA-processing protein EBP2 [Nakaseomyces glabratus]KTB09436.1 rRNA-processing protein EBP2 [Nakaseomyces glabratus]KTB16290.1 rRNA-processing protein EBP2 [Nakaseomyces glabratus]